VKTTKTTFFSLFSKISLLLVALLLVGCSKSDLFTQLDEKEANEVMAILLRNGIDSYKTPGDENKWIVRVEKHNFSEAVDILADFGYPRDTYHGLGEIFQKSGLVSSPAEERIRYMYGLSQDLEETLSQINGVLTARVHVVIPNNDIMADHVTPASAAIFLKYRKNSGVEEVIPQIKNLVVKSIEGLNYEDVSLVLFPLGEKEVATFTTLRKDVSAYEDNLFDWSMMIIVAILLAAGAGGLYYYRMLQQKQSGTDSTPKPPAQG
tara:strand:+ start:16372 stop:17163 length:792 start_codon:yes stop_codon:yes gene_type:complete